MGNLRFASLTDCVNLPPEDGLARGIDVAAQEAVLVLRGLLRRRGRRGRRRRGEEAAAAVASAREECGVYAGAQAANTVSSAAS